MMSRIDPALLSKTPSPQLCEHLKTILSDICSKLYEDKVGDFISTLSEFQRDLYQEVVKIPYSSKDFWRNIHDIIVTTQVMRLVAASEGDLPNWLVDVSILHDRGYALLSELSSRGFSPSQVGNYNALQGAHWDGIDTRIAHSLNSVKVARYIFDGRSEDPQVDAIVKECGVLQLRIPQTVREHTEELLKVIQEHDYPLIGRYGEISPLTKHHFDADSLYSISVTSFVKDYIFYLSDTSKMERWREIFRKQGESSSQFFQLRDLFVLRINRYFQEGDSISDLLTPFLRKKGEFGESLFEAKETIRPHSFEAQKRTEEAFLRLLALVVGLEGVSTEVQFTRVVEDAARAELASI